MTAADRAHQSFVVDPPSGRRDLARYGLSAIVVAVAFVALALVLGSVRRIDEVAPVEDAIMVDLPPAEPPPRQGEGGIDDDNRQAADAAAGQVAPPIPPPVEEPPRPLEPEMPAETLPDAPPPAPDAMLQREQTPPPKPQPEAAAPRAAQEATQASGSDVATDGASDQPDAPVSHVSARVLLQWQKAMVAQIARARRSLGHLKRDSGTTTVAFTIDHDGRLTQARVSRSCGNLALDEDALRLVRHAAPFPPPPRGATDKEMSFVVPIRFKRT